MIEFIWVLEMLENHGINMVLTAIVYRAVAQNTNAIKTLNLAVARIQNFLKAHGYQE